MWFFSIFVLTKSEIINLNLFVLFLCRFPGDDIPIIRGSALCALKGEKPELGRSEP